MRSLLAVAILLAACVQAQTGGGAGSSGPGQGGVIAASAAVIENVSVTPSTLTFNSANPDSGAAISNPVTLNFSVRNGDRNAPWSVTISAAAAPSGSCAAVTPFNLTAACESVQSQGTASGSCAQPFTLSGIPQVLASGAQGNNRRDFAIVLRFRFVDNWTIKPTGASSCDLNINYVINAP